jgi:hypothetical protein
MQDAELLTRVLTDARIWTSLVNNSPHSWTVWNYGMRVVNSCVHERNPYVTFNVHQLQRSHFVKRILHFMIELTQGAYVIQNHSDAPTAHGAQSITTVFYNFHLFSS